MSWFMKGYRAGKHHYLWTLSLFDPTKRLSDRLVDSMQDMKHLIIVLVVVVGLACLCGCSTQESASDTVEKAGNGGPATDSGLRIITEDLPPFNYVDADGNITGQATEVVNEILARLNQKATIEILPWNEAYRLALAGPKVVLYSTARTEEREERFKWVGPIENFDYTLYARKGSGFQINSLEAAKKAGSIGVERNSSRHQFLQQNQFSDIMTCDTDIECLRNLTAGVTALWLGSRTNMIDIAQKAGIDPSAVEAAYTIRTIPLYIAFSPDISDEVIAHWQAALDAMKRDGTFGTIQSKYGLIPTSGTMVSETDEGQAELALEIVVGETAQQLKAVLRPLEVVAVTDEARSANWQNIRPLLAVLEEKEPAARTWYALPDGSYYTVVDGLTSSNLKSRTYFPVVLGGNESVGTVVVSHSTGKNAAITAVPVKIGNVVTGVMGASVYLDTLMETIRMRVPEPFSFYAIDSENKFALHSEMGQISRNITTIDPSSSFGRALDTIRAQDSGMVEYMDGGIHYAAKFRSDSLTGWRFVVAWPKANNSTVSP
jgi:ABC-type amino acid transport substrate-binding protein